jgi:hypothetical protein
MVDEQFSAHMNNEVADSANNSIERSFSQLAIALAIETSLGHLPVELLYFCFS